MAVLSCYNKEEKYIFQKKPDGLEMPFFNGDWHKNLKTKKLDT